MNPIYDFNLMERRARDLMAAGRAADAISIYLHMAGGDHSIDGGYLGEKLGECYESLGELHAAKYWYGRAIKENPDARPFAVQARIRLASVDIESLLVEKP